MLPPALLNVTSDQSFLTRSVAVVLAPETSDNIKYKYQCEGGVRIAKSGCADNHSHFKSYLFVCLCVSVKNAVRCTFHVLNTI